MSRLTGLRPAGLLAASIGVVAVACGTDTIDLLPLSAGRSMAGGGSGGQAQAGAGGTEITAGSAGVSGGSGGMGGRPTVAGDAGSAGSFQNGGAGRGGGYGCVGFGCGGAGGFGTSGSGGNDARCPDPGSPWCVPCTMNDECPPQFSCNTFISYCRPTCTTAADCPKDGICDAMSGTCGPCFSDPQCSVDGNPKRQACELPLGRCVECNERVDCMRGNCFSLQCIVCDDDKDCLGGKHCDKNLGKCL